jgi:hypothetical protein
MKNRLSFLLCGMLCLFSYAAVSQVAPMFEMSIYFEDGIGNKDSVIVGYDTSAIANDLNPQFGEAWIFTPFDSTFEVRVIHSDDWQHRTSRKVIDSFDDSPDYCGASGGVGIMLSAKHLPIKISYDTALIHASSCHRNMILSPDWQIFLQQYWWDADVWYCMSNYDEIIDSSDYMIHPEDNVFLKYEFEVEGHGMKELAGYFWVVKWIGICETLIGTEEIEAGGSAIKISPNPAGDEISLELPKWGKAERIDFYDSFGRNVKSLGVQNSPDTSKIQIGDLPAGFYIGCATVSGGRAPLAFKLVKQ